MLIVKHPIVQPWHKGTPMEQNLVNNNWLQEKGIGMALARLLFPGGVFFTDTPRTRDGFICSERDTYLPRVAPPPSPSPPWWKPKTCGHFERISFQRPSGLRTVPGKKIVWISRRGATNKHMLNEAAVMAALQKELPTGVVTDVVQMETLSLRDQIRTFATASLVIMMRGAAVAHSVFLPRGAVLLYLHFCDNWDLSPCFFRGSCGSTL